MGWELPKYEVIAEGKTKAVVRTEDGQVLLIYKNTITKHNDPTATREFGAKAATSNATNTALCTLLRDAGVPVAFIRQCDETSFFSQPVRMLPLEVVIRRHGVGSYRKRHPDVPATDPPKRFDRLVVEFFLKTSRGLVQPYHRFSQPDNTEPDQLSAPVDISEFIDDWNPDWEDPLIAMWESCQLDTGLMIQHPKRPTWDSSPIVTTVSPSIAVPDISWTDEIEKLARQVFLVLEGAWRSLGYHFVDLKIEVGVTADGQLVVADVIDLDSCRLCDPSWREMSKENFRQGVDLEQVERDYIAVAQLATGLRIPSQTIVLWRGSYKDDWPDVSNFPVGSVSWRQITLSGHKQTAQCLAKLNELANISDGAILALVGRSNGLGPVLAGNATLPVVTCPLTYDKFPDDISSSLRMPSELPLLTAWPASNALLAIANILASRNPALYAWLQGIREDNLVAKAEA